MKCSPTVKDVYSFIDSFASFSTQCEWDNSGIIVGDTRKEVKKIAVVLDITPQAVEYAKNEGVDLIVSHHPVIFRAVKSITDSNPAFLLAGSGIAAICTHTPLDIAKGGVNDALAEALGFDNAFPLSEDGETAMIRVAEIPEATGEALAKLCAEKLGSAVRLSDSGRSIRRVALCGGAGADFAPDAFNSGCDALITGDASHHEFLDAQALGLTLIAAGHFETENPVVARLADMLGKEFDAEVIIIPQDSPVSYHN